MIIFPNVTLFSYFQNNLLRDVWIKTAQQEKYDWHEKHRQCISILFFLLVITATKWKNDFFYQKHLLMELRHCLRFFTFAFILYLSMWQKYCQFLFSFVCLISNFQHLEFPLLKICDQITFILWRKLEMSLIVFHIVFLIALSRIESWWISNGLC